MTETRVIIDIDREATPDQMTTMQDGIETSIDHIVGDALIAESRYYGMLASYAGTVVTIGTGRLYNGSKVYAYDTEGTFDMVSKLPLATKKNVLIIAYGSEADTDTAEVNYLVEAQSTPSAPVYQAQAVATTHRRLAVVQAAYGDEAPNPSDPAYGTALPIARIVLSPTGIVSCENLTDNAGPNLVDIDARTAALEAFEAEIGPEVSTLASELAALSNSLPGASLQSALTRAFLSIATLDAKVGIPSTASDASADFLLDGSNSDLTHPSSSCKVMEGVRFPDDGADTSVFNIFNPFDPNAALKSNGMLFPAYARYLRSSTGKQTGTVLANSYTYNPIDYSLQTVTQQRTSYGTPFDVCTNSSFWNSGSYNPLTGIFTLPSGATYKAAADNLTNGAMLGYIDGNGNVDTHTWVRLQQFWTDEVSSTYWDAVVSAPQTINGYHLFESFLNGQDQWIDAIGVPLGALDASGDMTVVVTEAGANAIPNPAMALASVTLAYANLVANTENVFALVNPILLESGKRYSVGVITAAGHAIAITDGPNFPQGTFFQLSPSGFAAGDLTKHLCLNFYGCKFNNSTVSIQLQNLQLAGGMTGIQILAPTIVPASTTLTYEIQLAGVWTPLNAQTVGQLNAGGSLPPNVPIRVTMSGTQDMMPALNLAQSQVNVSRPATSFTHIWPKDPRTPPVSVTTVGVIEEYDSYDDALHSAGVTLLSGAGYATETSPDSYTITQQPDGNYLGTYVFTFGTAIDSYYVKTAGTTTTALNTFLVAFVKDYSF